MQHLSKNLPRGLRLTDRTPASSDTYEKHEHPPSCFARDTGFFISFLSLPSANA